MKGSTARRIVKIYKWTVATIVSLVIVATFVALTIAEWKAMVIMFVAVGILFGLLWLFISADVDKNNPD